MILQEMLFGKRQNRKNRACKRSGRIPRPLGHSRLEKMRGGRQHECGESRMRPDLHHSFAEHQYLRDRLEAEFPEADEDTLRDTLEGLSSLPEALAAVLRSYLDDL